MTSLPLHRIHGWIAPVLAAFAAALVLALPSMARADDMHGATAITSTTVVAPAAGTSAATANTGGTFATSSTASATDDTSSTTAGDASDGSVARPDSASWQ